MNKGTRSVLYFLAAIAGALLVIFTNLIWAGVALMFFAFMVAVVDGDCGQ